MDLLLVLYDMYIPYTIESAQKMPCFFRALNDEISNVFIAQELYITLNWPAFQNHRKTHLPIKFWHNIYIKDQRKWAKMKISGQVKGEFARI